MVVTEITCIQLSNVSQLDAYRGDKRLCFALSSKQSNVCLKQWRYKPQRKAATSKHVSNETNEQKQKLAATGYNSAMFAHCCYYLDGFPSSESIFS